MVESEEFLLLGVQVYACIVSQLRTNENNNIFKELCKVTMPCIDQDGQTLGALHSRLGEIPERNLRDYGFLATTDNIEIRSFQNILLENWSMVLLLMAPSLIFMKLKNHK